MGEEPLPPHVMKALSKREAKTKKKVDKALRKGKYQSFIWDSARWIAQLHKNGQEDWADRALGDLISVCNAKPSTPMNKEFLVNYEGFQTLGDFVEPLNAMRGFYESFYKTRSNLLGGESVAYEASALFSSGGGEMQRGRDLGIVAVRRTVEQYFDSVGRLLITPTRILAIRSPARITFVSKGGKLEDQKVKVRRVMPVSNTLEVPREKVSTVELSKVKIKGMKTVRLHTTEGVIDILIENEIKYPGMPYTTPEEGDPTDARLVFDGPSLALGLSKGLQKQAYDGFRSAGWAT